MLPDMPTVRDYGQQWLNYHFFLKMARKTGFMQVMRQPEPLWEGNKNKLLRYDGTIDDVPWLYEAAMEAFRALTSGTQKSVEHIVRSVKMLRELPMRSRMFEELMMGSKEMHMLVMEGPHMLERMVMMCLEERKGH